MPASTGWFPVARATEVGTTPVPVGADGRAYVHVPADRLGVALRQALGEFRLAARQRRAA